MGLTANVVAGAPILSAWGNEIRDRTAQVFASAAERSAQWAAPPEGAHSYLADTNTMWFYDGAAWVLLAGGTRIGCRLQRTTVLSIPNNAITAVPMTVAVEDSGGFFASGPGDAVIPAGMAGQYLITGNAYFPAAFWRGPSASARLNGTRQLLREMALLDSAISQEYQFTVTGPARLAAGDHVQLAVHHVSAGPANLGVYTAATPTDVVAVTPTLELWRIGA